jgi:hypothetical protein
MGIFPVFPRFACAFLVDGLEEKILDAISKLVGKTFANSFIKHLAVKISSVFKFAFFDSRGDWKTAGFV